MGEYMVCCGCGLCVCMGGCLIYVDVDGFMCVLCVYHVTNMVMLCYWVHTHTYPVYTLHPVVYFISLAICHF